MLQYYVLYKPYEVLCQFSKEGNKQTLKDCTDLPTDIYPVGRLDYDSEGLIVLTNDKSINAALLHPSNAHERTYLVQVEGLVSDAAIEAWTKGVDIQVNGVLYRTKPAKAERCTKEPELPPRNPPIRFRKNIPTSWVSLTLTEGKNRQVRKMTAQMGFPTLRLVRFKIGKLSATGWASGELRSYTKKELQQLIFTSQSQ